MYLYKENIWEDSAITNAQLQQLIPDYYSHVRTLH